MQLPNIPNQQPTNANKERQGVFVQFGQMNQQRQNNMVNAEGNLNGSIFLRGLNQSNINQNKENNFSIENYLKRLIKISQEHNDFFKLLCDECYGMQLIESEVFKQHIEQSKGQIVKDEFKVVEIENIIGIDRDLNELKQLYSRYEELYGHEVIDNQEEEELKEYEQQENQFQNLASSLNKDIVRLSENDLSKNARAFVEKCQNGLNKSQQNEIEYQIAKKSVLDSLQESFRKKVITEEAIIQGFEQNFQRLKIKEKESLLKDAEIFFQNHKSNVQNLENLDNIQFMAEQPQNQLGNPEQPN